MSADLASQPPARGESSFHRALDLISQPDQRPQSRQEEEQSFAPAPEDMAVRRPSQSGPELLDPLAQLMAQFAAGGMPMLAHQLPPPHHPAHDFPAGALLQSPFGPFPPPPFGPQPNGVGPCAAGGPVPPPFPFPLDPATLATFQPFMLPPEHRRKNATREVTAPLKHWLLQHKRNPYPNKGEKMALAFVTRMTMTQVSTWFANARRRLKKENKMTWSPRNRTNEEEGEDEADGEAEAKAVSAAEGGGPAGEGPSGSASPAEDREAGREGPRKRRIWSIEETLAAEDGRGSSRRQEQGAQQHQQQQSMSLVLPMPPPPLAEGGQQGLFPVGLPPPLAFPLCLDPHLLLALAQASPNGLPLGPLPPPLAHSALMLLSQQIALAASQQHLKKEELPPEEEEQPVEGAIPAQFLPRKRAASQSPSAAEQEDQEISPATKRHCRAQN